MFQQHLTQNEFSASFAVRQSGITDELPSHSEISDLEVNRISVPGGNTGRLAMESSRGDPKVLRSRTMQVCPT